MSDNPYGGLGLDQAFNDSLAIVCLMNRINKFETALERGCPDAPGPAAEIAEASSELTFYLAASAERDKASRLCRDAMDAYRDSLIAAMRCSAVHWRVASVAAKEAILFPAHRLTQEVLQNRHPAYTGTVGERN